MDFAADKGRRWNMESVWFATQQVSVPSSGALVDGTRADMVVAGAGLTGMATAALLARSGLTVVVLEARTVGAVTTGNTTAKLSLLQGTVLSDIASHQPDDVLRAYVEAQREGQAWLARFMDDREVPYQRRDAYTFATTPKGEKKLRAELDAGTAAGLDLIWVDETELPLAAKAIKLPDQVQIHPLLVLQELVDEVIAHGGVILEGVRVTDAHTDDAGVTVSTNRGTVRADRMVLATGIPILDRGGHFARLVPLRSYASTYRVPGPIPQGMYLGVDQPTRSLRTVTAGDEELLLVGGNGHITGRSDSPAAAVADLVAWTQDHFPGAEPLHAWSAQDYRSGDRIPYVGPLAWSGGRIHVATGFNKWGMTNAIAAALTLSSQLLDGSMEWAETLQRRTPTVAGVVDTVGPNVQVAGELAKDWVQAEVSALPDEAPGEGDGVVGRGAGGLPEAVSTVDGTTCRVRAICTHLGGIVRWNDAEKSWDCPLHGSRFAADGTRLEGPAVADLERVDVVR